jgi:hypothetical protein
VEVRVNGVVARLSRVIGPTGEIEVDPNSYPNVALQKRDPGIIPDPGTTVTVSYTYDRSLLRTDLLQRVFYRATTVGYLVDLNCATEVTPILRETPLERAAVTSSVEVEKIDWIWREAVRRNRWILDQGGERVKVFIRKHVGEICGCTQTTTHKQPLNDCHVCFAPQTLVRTDTGYKPINTVAVGDHVLSSSGQYSRVTRVFETPFTGDLLAIRSAVSTNAILTTLNHPFYTLVGHHGVVQCRPTTCHMILDRDNVLYSIQGQGTGVRQLPSGRWWARAGAGTRGKRISLGTFSTEEEAKQVVQSYRLRHKKAHSLEWLRAEDLDEDDWLVAQYPRTVRDLTYVEIPLCFQKTSQFGPDRQGVTRFDVDEEFLWVVGLYLAEGSAGGRSITFALHADEVDYQSRVKRFFDQRGYTASIRVDSGDGLGAVVVVNGSHLSEWFPVWLGRHCDKKRIPEELMCLPPKKQQWLLQGIYDGDGWKNGTEVTQTSELLALQLSEVLHRIGKRPLIRQQRSKALTPKGNPRKLAYCVNWEGSEFTNASRKGRWSFEGQELSRIKGITKVPYEGPVYNLEVEGDHTYVVQGVVVHNCYGTSIVGGYEGPFDVVMAPDDAERKHSQRDTGRTIEHGYEVWTGPSPLLSQRDFVVKITGDRYSVGAVRMPTNRGMVLQQHFMLGHLDEKDIRYRVPIDLCNHVVSRYVDRLVPPLNSPAQITDKSNIPSERQIRGRTITWENIVW